MYHEGCENSVPCKIDGRIHARQSEWQYLRVARSSLSARYPLSLPKKNPYRFFANFCSHFRRVVVKDSVAKSLQRRRWSSDSSSELTKGCGKTSVLLREKALTRFSFSRFSTARVSQMTCIPYIATETTWRSSKLKAISTKKRWHGLIVHQSTLPSCIFR